MQTKGAGPLNSLSSLLKKKKKLLLEIPREVNLMYKHKVGECVS